MIPFFLRVKHINIIEKFCVIVLKSIYGAVITDIFAIPKLECNCIHNPWRYNLNFVELMTSYMADTELERKKPVDDQTVNDRSCEYLQLISISMRSL